MLTINLSHLRVISLIEGISYLMLLCIGMPLKYIYSTPLPNKILGMGHGVLTLVFIAALYWLFLNKKLSFKLAITVFIASLIPCGAFFVDKYLKAEVS